MKIHVSQTFDITFPFQPQKYHTLSKSKMHIEEFENIILHEVPIYKSNAVRTYHSPSAQFLLAFSNQTCPFIEILALSLKLAISPTIASPYVYI